MKIIIYMFLLFSSYLYGQINLNDNLLYKTYFNLADYPTALKMADSLQINGTYTEITSSYIIQARYKLYKQDNDHALKLLKIAKKRLNEKEDPLGSYIYHLSQALYYMITDKTYDQLKHYIEAIKIKEKYSIYDTTFLMEKGLMSYYFLSENYDKMFRIGNSILEEMEKNKDKYNTTKSLIFRLKALGSMNRNDYKNSQSYLDSAMYYSKYYKDTTQLSRAIKYQADLYLHLKKYNTAKRVALVARKLYKKHDKKNIIEINELLGHIAFQQKKYDTAKFYYEKVLHGDFIRISEYIKTSKNYRYILEKEKNIAKAYFYLKREDSIRNANTGKDALNKVLNLELDYNDFKNNYILEKRKERTRWIVYSLVLSILGIILLSLLLYQRSKNIKKLEKSQSIVENANHELKNVNFKLEKFTKIVSHDLKAPIRSIGSLATFIAEDEIELKESSRKYIQLIHESVMTTENLILNMLTLAHSKNNSFEKINVDFDTIIKQLKSNLLYDINKSNASIVMKNKPKFIVGNEFFLIQLFQNFIQNSIKYRADTRPLLIEIDYDPTIHRILIKDNGIGMQTKNIDHLFQIYKQQHFQSIDKGIGLGLYITKTIADLHEIKITVNSKINSGTVINLFFKEGTIY